MTNIIESQGLTKHYKKHIALDGVNINVQEGDVYGLIGRNGAGKTTLMKIINRQIRSSEGKLWIQGQDISVRDNHSLRIGSLIEAPGFYPDMSAQANLQLKCDLFGIRRPGYVDELLDLVDLRDVKNKKIKNFSLGMKQRLGLALALVGDPDILILDEPTNGMDPQGIRDFRQTILKLNHERNITVIISSHILGELAKFINRVGIIHEGRLMREASMESLYASNQDFIRVMGADQERMVSYLEETINLRDYKSISPTELRIFEHLDDPGLVSHALIRGGILFDQLVLENSSLEDYYMNLTGGHDHA